MTKAPFELYRYSGIITDEHKEVFIGDQERIFWASRKEINRQTKLLIYRPQRVILSFGGQKGVYR